MNLRLLFRNSLPVAGSNAPAFTLPSQDGSMVSLGQHRGQWVILYFYPKDHTPGCTVEAHKFEIDRPEYARRNAVVLGVSLDSVDSHRRFCAQQSLKFQLLADACGRTARAYGSLMNLGIVKIAQRHTFVIDPSGRIAKAYRNVNPAQHSAEILAALDQLQNRQLQIQQTD
jgi:peroxiredoxin Q/BCP